MSIIVVTTPTGAIGRHVIENLLEHDQTIRVIVRDPSNLSTKVREQVEVVQGSHGDEKVVDKALKGSDSVFWLVPPDPRAESLDAAYLDFTRPACESIRRHGVKHIVSVSALGRGTPMAGRAGLVKASLAMDDLLAATGAKFLALTMPSFMDNLLRQAAAIKAQGVFRSPIDPDRKMPTCAVADIAASAAGLLLDTSWTGKGHVAVLGPEDLSNNDMAQILSEVLGKPIRYEQVSFDAFATQLKKSGMSDAFVHGYVDMMRAKNDGLDNAEPRTEESTTPTSFRQWCADVLNPALTN